MNHKLRRLLENCLCSGRRQTLFFFCLVLHTSRLLMVCQQKKKKASTNTRACTSTSTSCAASTSSERCGCIGSWRDSRPLCMSTKQKDGRLASFGTQRFFLITLRRRGWAQPGSELRSRARRTHNYSTYMN